MSDRTMTAGTRPWTGSRPHRSTRHLVGRRPVPWGLARLTPRQDEVLSLMAAGHTNAAIARRLDITEKAVVRHVSNIYDLLLLAPSTEEHRRVVAVVRYLTAQDHLRVHDPAS
jgi:DNA-binding NarL/FixJ family response regulator